MFNNDTIWEAWGQQDPYYAILSNERFRLRNITKTREEFFQSGSASIASILALLEQHFGAIARGRALDFGCGVGRLTIPLATHFAAVTGLDVSPAMLALARKNSAGLPIDYTLSGPGLDQLDRQFDFISSLLTFQHISVNRGMQIVDRLLALVNNNGAIALHFCIRRPSGRISELRYWLKHRVPGGLALFNLLHGRPLRSPAMQMSEYSVSDIVTLFKRHDITKTLMIHENHDGFETALLLARRDNQLSPIGA